MRTRALLTVVCLLAAGVAGCLGNDEAPGTPEAGDPPGTTQVPEPIELEDCTEHFGTYPIPASEARPYLPDGFQPTGVDDEALPEGMATVAVFGLGCQRVETGAPIIQFFTVLPVDPPPAYQNASVTLHYVLVNGATDDPEVLSTYQAWGLAGMTSAELEFETRTPTPATAEGHVRATNGTQGAHLVTTVTGPVEDFPGGIARFYGVEERQVTSLVDFAYTGFDANAGQAFLENDGMVPFSVEGPAAGISGTDAAGSFQPVELGKGAGAGEDEGLSSGFTVDDCTEQAGIFTVAASEVEPYLPDGFTLVGLDGQPLREGQGTILVITLVCQGPGTGEPTSQLWVEVVVDPPDRYERADADLHYIHVTGRTTSPAISETWDAWGIPRLDPGGVQLDGEPGALGPDTWETSATNATTSARLATTAVGDHPPVIPGNVRIIGVDEREVTGLLDVHWNAPGGAAGEATLEDDGLIPIDVEERGTGFHFWGHDATFRPASPSGEGLGLDQRGDGR